MRLRTRVLIMIGLTTAIVVAGQYALSNWVLLGSYRSLERGAMQRDVQRASQALGQLAEELHVKSVDWAEWDDTYRFMQDRDPAYVRSNLVESGLAAMQLDLVVYCDPQWRIVKAVPVHRPGGMPPPDPRIAVGALRRVRGPGAALTSRLGVYGLIAEPNAPLLVSARPILTTSGKGPARGWLVFARYFDAEQMQQLGRRTRLDVHFHNVAAGEVPAADVDILGELSARPGPLVSPQDDRRIAGADLVRDIDDRPLLLLQVQGPRSIYQQGLRATRYLVAVIVVASLILSVAVLLLLERVVLSRTVALSAQVRRIAAVGSWVERVRLSGRDELSALADTINVMLDAQQSLHTLQQQEARLRARNEKLEAEVADRVAQIQHQALHDPLTDLPNRALFMDRLELALRRVRRSHLGVAALFLDLDNFKDINDTKGHEAGDRLLNDVAERLRNCVRPGDTVARLGGDEFTVVLEELGSVAEAEQVADRIMAALRAPIYIPPDEVAVSGSIGIAYSALSDDSADALLRNADTAMYVAKTNGKGGYAVFHQGMNDRVVERVEIESGLRRALDNDELRVYYQPVMDLATGRMSGVEALVRWQHPERGLIPPGRFLPVAEDSGLIIPLGYRVLEQVCRDMRIWHETRGDDAPPNASVNLSAKQLMRADVVSRVAEILQRSGLEPALLTLEISENVLTSDGEACAARLLELRGLGVRLAMDNFGSGYSSLASLQALPLDGVKIDRAFTARLSEGAQGKAAVAAIIELSRTIRLEVTAEGVETAGQLEGLQELGCTAGQGFLFARPMPAEEVAQLRRDLAALGVHTAPEEAPRDRPVLVARQLAPGLS